jgi:hypothetical protein
MSSTADLAASTVMDGSATLLNDSAKSVYTYAAQIPYLRIAMQELQEYFELNNIPVTQEVSAVIPVNPGVTAITFDAAGTAASPKLPDDLVEPAQVWERTHNIDPFIPMTKRDYLPHYLEGIQTEQYIYYVWEDQQIKFLPSISFNDIKIDYVRQIFNNIPNLDQNTQINVINATTFLEYRTAALMAEFIERNITSAQGLNSYATLGLDRVTGIGVKGRQNIMTRRRPFRSGYKKRGWMT